MTGPQARVVLGRDGMGDDADESDFDAYCAHISAHIDERCGFAVEVEIAEKRDVQSNRVFADDAQRVRDALTTLWDEFCADEALWPSRVHPSGGLGD
jgi:hypothetical protein